MQIAVLIICFAFALIQYGDTSGWYPAPEVKCPNDTLPNTCNGYIYKNSHCPVFSGKMCHYPCGSDLKGDYPDCSKDIRPSWQCHFYKCKANLAPATNNVGEQFGQTWFNNPSFSDLAQSKLVCSYKDTQFILKNKMDALFKIIEVFNLSNKDLSQAMTLDNSKQIVEADAVAAQTLSPKVVLVTKAISTTSTTSTSTPSTTSTTSTSTTSTTVDSTTITSTSTSIAYSTTNLPNVTSAASLSVTSVTDVPVVSPVTNNVPLFDDDINQQSSKEPEVILVKYFIIF